MLESLAKLINVLVNMLLSDALLGPTGPHTYLLKEEKGVTKAEWDVPMIIRHNDQLFLDILCTSHGRVVEFVLCFSSPKTAEDTKDLKLQIDTKRASIKWTVNTEAGKRKQFIKESTTAFPLCYPSQCLCHKSHSSKIYAFELTLCAEK